MLDAALVIQIHTQTDEDLVADDGRFLRVLHTLKQVRHSRLKDVLHLSQNESDFMLK